MSQYFPSVPTQPKTVLTEEGKQIFVKNCPSSWTHEDLYQHFIEFGEIRSSKVSIDANFNSRGFGFVEFAEVDNARRAIEEMNQKEVEEEQKGSEDSKKVLIVSLYETKKNRNPNNERLPCNNLYVKNFPKKKISEESKNGEQVEEDFTDDDLKELFQEHGEIQNAVVMRDENGNSRGFGFVCFKDGRDAKKALDSYSSKDKSDTSYSADQLYVTEAKSKQQRQDELMKNAYRYKMSQMYLNLIVKNLDPNTSEEDIKQYFMQFGNITSVKLVQKSVEMNIGFVCFKDRESAA